MLRALLFAALVLCSQPTLAAAVLISFDDLSEGDIVTSQYAAQGVTLSLIGSGAPAGPRANAVVNGQPIGPNAFGVAGVTITPGTNNTSSLMYDLQFDFVAPVDYFSIQVLDAEESFDIVAYFGATALGSGITTSLGSLGTPVNGPLYLAEFGSLGGSTLFDRVILDISNGSATGSGGPEFFDNLRFEPVAVSEPSSAAVLFAGLAALLIAGSLGRAIRSAVPDTCRLGSAVAGLAMLGVKTSCSAGSAADNPNFQYNCSIDKCRCMKDRMRLYSVGGDWLKMESEGKIVCPVRTNQGWDCPDGFEPVMGVQGPPGRRKCG